MSNEDTPADPDSATGPLYATRFREHLADVRAHLAGLDRNHLQPSYIPPTGYWTPSEKSTFFHSLGVYSRFRPDLVAACIGTKTVVDVCAYIDALDGALSRDRHLLPPRSGLEGAMEVSAAWTRREEQMVEGLSSLEPEWEAQTMLLQREEEVSAKRVSAATGGASSSTGHETWESDRRRHWAQEDVLSQLDCHHLRVMEGILKEAEFGDPDVEDALPEDQPVAGNTAQMPLPPPENPSDRTSHLGDAMMIDPILLGIPVPDQPLQNNLPPRHLEPLTLPPAPNPSDPRPPCNPASSPPSPQVPALPQASSYARSPSPEGGRELAQDPSDLSPVSRRRFQKRLYMRRKRASLRGEEASAVVAKLRPGRKVVRKTPKSRRKTLTNESEPQGDSVDGEDALMDVDQDVVAVTRPSSSILVETLSQADEEDDEEEEGIDSDDESQPRKGNKGGLTKHYKIKRGFAVKGIDADTLLNNDLGFFHLSTLSRLMTLYKSGFDTKNSDAVTAISADTIRLLTAIIEEFTTEVVQRTFTSREQENKMKGSIKVYHHQRDISVDNVHHVLEMMGMRGLTKRQYFAQLLGEDMSETDEEQLPAEDEGASEGEEDKNGEGENDEDGSEDDDEESDDDDDGSPHLAEPRIFPDLLPLNREIHPPLIHLPKSLLAHNSARGTAPATDDLLMPVDTDEEELLEELEDEIELDKTDKVAAKAYEADLWMEFGRS
ncbi:hypothetical protein DXG03_001495 [Asterophora parasitica]|uniref:Uncharacterized protein n=1 Tax=Asterophora parasitica TaxID=117018 RepID=A0A9P7G9H3_9AGAR|nr:hypothetical protein DXG03_001495 [Asterophora parasitica]